MSADQQLSWEIAPPKKVTLDALPPRLLLRILGLLEPMQLLTSASAVCRKWRKLALDPRLWGRVAVRYEEDTERPWAAQTRPSPQAAGRVDIEGRARVALLEVLLLRVPCLLRLQVSLRPAPTPAVLRALEAAALVPVESLAIMGVPLPYVRPLLEASATTLRCLEWRMQKLRPSDQDWNWSRGPGGDEDEDEDDDDEEKEAEKAKKKGKKKDKEQPKRSPEAEARRLGRMSLAIWRYLATSLRLSELVLDWTWLPTDVVYSKSGTTMLDIMRMIQQVDMDSVPRRHYPAIPSQLTSLRVQTRSHSKSVPWQEAWLWPVVAGAAPRLQELSLRLEPVQLPVVLMCGQLRSLTIPLVKGMEDIPRHCPHLRRVTLLGDDHWSGADCCMEDEDDPRRKSVMFLAACAHRKLAIESLTLESFSKYSVPQLLDACGPVVGRFKALRELRLIKSVVRGCDTSWKLLAELVGRLRQLERLEVGFCGTEFAGSVPLGSLTRLGRALPPSVRYLRLDGLQRCDRLKAELHAAVAGRRGLHVAVTGYGCSDRCELTHGGFCGVEVVAFHGDGIVGGSAGLSPQEILRRLVADPGNKWCGVCAPMLRYRGASFMEPVMAPRLPADPRESQGRSRAAWCCGLHWAERDCGFV